MAHLTPRTCLLCNNYYDRKPEIIAAFDSDDDHYQEEPHNQQLKMDYDEVDYHVPTTGREDGRSCMLGKCFEEFWKGFKLFCRLLRVNSTTVNGSDDDDETLLNPTSELPCCGECDVVLMDLLKLQNIIEETKKQQFEVLKRLKLVVVSNQCDRESRLDDCWTPVRARLINSLSMQESGVRNPAKMEFLSNDEEETPSDQFDNDTDDEDMDRSSLASVSSLINKNSKIGASSCLFPDVDQNFQEFPDIDSPKAEPIVRAKIRKRKIISQVAIGRKTRAMDEVDVQTRNDSSPNVPETETETESRRGESSAPVIYEKNAKLRGNGNRETKCKKNHKEGELFFLLSDDLLAYKGILIRFSPAEFVCLEDDCGRRINGSDYFAFEEFRKHAKDCHNNLLTDSANVRQQKRSCPLCPQEFGSLRRFRRHTFGKHRPPTVCIICWKPLKSYNIMDNHVWSHMNNEEKAAAGNYGHDRSRILHINRMTYNAKRSQKRTVRDLKPSQKAHSSVFKASLKRKSKIKKTEDASKDIKLHTRKSYKESDLFFLLSDNYMAYKGILIQTSPTGFICQERGCGTIMLGTDYFAFEEFRNHVKNCHPLLLGDCVPAIGDSTIKGFEEPRSCPLCSEQFESLRRFRRHIFGKHSPPAICTSCWKPLISYNCMNNHVWFHMNEEERALAEAEGYDRNLKYQPKGPFQCASCQKQFNTKIDLRAHEKTHIPVHLRPQFECLECGAKLLYKRSLRSHMERLHNPELVTRKRECYICLKQFNFADGDRYRNHMRSHTGEKTRFCHVCGKGFNDYSTFKLHCETVHTTARPFQCEFCAMSYKRRSALKRHQRSSHKGLVQEGDPEVSLKTTKAQFPHLQPDFIGPRIAYPCEHCGKVFQLRSRMTKHVKLSHRELAH